MLHSSFSSAAAARAPHTNDIELADLSSAAARNTSVHYAEHADDERTTMVPIAPDRAMSRITARSTYWQTAKRTAKSVGIFGLVACGGALTHGTIQSLHPRACTVHSPQPHALTAPSPAPSPASSPMAFNTSNSTNASEAPNEVHPLYELSQMHLNRQYYRYGAIDVDKQLGHSFPAAVKYLMRSLANRNTLEKLKAIEPELYEYSADPHVGGDNHHEYNDRVERLTIDRGDNSQFVPILNKVIWNDTHKYAVLDESAPHGVAVLSAAGGLMHELLHAENKADNSLAFMIRLTLVHPEFDTIEEKFTIERLNARKGADFPEAHRMDHHNIVTLPARNVTDAETNDIPENVAARLASSPNFYNDDTVQNYAGTQMIYQQLKVKLFSIAVLYQRFFNRTVLEEIKALADRGEIATSRYANSKIGGVPSAAAIADVASYSRAAEDLTARIVNVSKANP